MLTLLCLCRLTNCHFQHSLKCHTVDGARKLVHYVKMRDSPGLVFALVAMLACVEHTSMSPGERWKLHYSIVCPFSTFVTMNEVLYIMIRLDPIYLCLLLSSSPVYLDNTRKP